MWTKAAARKGTTKVPVEAAKRVGCSTVKGVATKKEVLTMMVAEVLTTRGAAVRREEKTVVHTASTTSHTATTAKGVCTAVTVREALAAVGLHMAASQQQPHKGGGLVMRVHLLLTRLQNRESRAGRQATQQVII